MRIHGTTFEITDLNGFVQQVIGSLSKSKSLTSMKTRSLLGTRGIVDTIDDTMGLVDDLLPDEVEELIESLTGLGIVQPLAGARVHLGLLVPGLLPGQHPSGSFFPLLSVKTSTNAAGAYTLNISDEHPAQLPALRAFLLVYQPSGSVSAGGQTVQLFSLLYRSTSFDLQPGDQVAAPIFVRREAGRADQAITQAEITRQVSAIQNKQKFDDMNAQIGDRKVAVRVADRGAKVTFDIELRGSSSPNLNEFIDFKIRNFAIDLPGPDFITTLCANEKEIERTVRSEVLSLERSANKEILTRIVKSVSQATLLPATVVEDFFRDNATVSIPAINTPRQSFREGSNVGFRRSIFLDVSIGVPRRLFKTEESKRGR
jgi:hypothetical protein